MSNKRSYTKQIIMRKKSFSIVAFTLICSNLIMAQDQVKIPNGISMAFKAGDATELSKFINATVELRVLDKEDFYKKNVAETILKDFFTGYKTKDFIIRHQGGTNDAQYAIGSMKTEKGDFRVYFLLKKVDQELLIHKISIDPDNGK
jgi:hypothetical protein